MALAQKYTHRTREKNRQRRNKLCTYGQLIYDNEGKNIRQRKVFSSINCAGKSGQLFIKE